LSVPFVIREASIRNVGDFQNNEITLEPRVVTLYGNHSYTLEHYYLLIDNEP